MSLYTDTDNKYAYYGNTNLFIRKIAVALSSQVLISLREISELIFTVLIFTHQKYIYDTFYGICKTNESKQQLKFQCLHDLLKPCKTTWQEVSISLCAMSDKASFTN